MPVEKEVTRIDKNGQEVRKNASHILKFIDSARFMTSTLSNLVNNLSEWIHRVKCKYGHDDKQCEICGIKYKYCNCFLEYTDFKDDSIEYKCLCCNKNYQQKFDENLKERFSNSCKWSNHNNNKLSYCCEKVFILMNMWKNQSDINTTITST